MLKEFKEFATRGNMLDMAIGVIIGGAFQKIITSLVNDMIMPAISIFTGKVDFSSLVINIGETSIKYGSFITAIIDFLIIAFSIFIAIKSVNSVNKRMEKIAKNELNKLGKKVKIGKKNNNTDGSEESEAQVPTVKLCPYCFSEINYNATKCPHCTSDLSVSSDSKE